MLEAIAALAEPALAQHAGPRTPAEAPPPTARPSAAERRQLTVMFVDLVGSTALSAALDPEEMSAAIRVYQNAVAGETLRFEGHIAKFMGDGVLAYFGWPQAHEDDAERAVRAGLALIKTVAALEGVGSPPGSGSRPASWWLASGWERARRRSARWLARRRTLRPGCKLWSRPAASSSVRRPGGWSARCSS